MSRERRGHERFPIGLEATLETADGRELNLRLGDVSAGGAYLEKTDPATPLPPAGSPVRFTIRYRSERGVEIESECARVVRVTDDGIGIEFQRDVPATLAAAG